MWTVRRIIAGGQTGADRAALDWARAHGILTGGWCPAGRRAEDVTIDGRYHLRETPSADYAQRTAWNVRDADGTVVIALSSHLGGGSLLTVEYTAQYRKPCLHLHRADADCGTRLQTFLMAYHFGVMNVTGPQVSTEPGIGACVDAVLDAWARHMPRLPEGGR